MKRFAFFTLLTATLLISACARIYKSPDIEGRATRHRVIAIAPPQVSLFPRKVPNAEVLKAQQDAESLSIQHSMWSWMMRRKAQGKMTIDVQDVETTNARLKAAGYYEGKALTPEEMCDILNVDGLIASRFSMSKPISDGAALAMGLLTDFWGPTNDINASLDIHDRQSGKLIWNYNRNIQGSVGSSEDRMVNALMRHASRRMPYKM